MLAKGNCNKGGVSLYDLICGFFTKCLSLSTKSKVAYHRMLKVDFLEVMKCATAKA